MQDKGGNNMKNILEYLETAAGNDPQKTGFTDAERSATFFDVMSNAKKIAGALKAYAPVGSVVIMMDRSIKCIEAMFSAVYAGGFYTVIDVHSPASRISAILKTLSPTCVIADLSCQELAEHVVSGETILLYEDAVRHEIDHRFIADVRRNMIDTDPLYVLFTSGSSGTPKGAVLSHRSVLSYIEWVSEAFAFDSSTSFGSQTPLYFSMSVTDLYSCIKCGGTYHMIPKSCFTFPAKLMDFLNQRTINTIYWVPSALAIASNWDLFAWKRPEYLKKILFAGEVMPVKHLNYWQKYLPDCTYANLFGPTETTDICTFYVLDRPFKNDERLPIGKACNNCDTFLLTADNRRAETGEEGELVVRGSFLSDGYYNDPEKTASAFSQNPLNKAYPERIYRTGDLAKLNEKGEFIYIARKDFQIKRMGYRIEPEEIEAAVNAIDGVISSAALYDASTQSLLLIYDGTVEDTALIRKGIQEKLPSYMYPDKIIRLEHIPRNSNGKIDRAKLKNDYTA